MPDAVIDASAMIELLTGQPPDMSLRRRTMLGQLAAPDIFDLEVANVLRRLVRRGALSDAFATEVLAVVGTTPVARSPHLPLVQRVWGLRRCVRAYDAKLAGSHGHGVKIELYPAPERGGREPSRS
jgi:predicted nucleic acid-binding protein